MAETVLFSQYIGNRGETDCLFLRLSADAEVSMRSITPIRMELSEMLSTGTPAVSFEFTDGNGDLVNHNKPKMSTTFYLDIGNSPINAKRIELRCSKIMHLNQRAGSSEQIAFKMFFVHKTWADFISRRKSRAWGGKNYSEIVRDLTANFTLTEIEDVPETPEFFVQPHWSDIQTIRYIRNKSLSTEGGHMEFGVTLEGKFIFKSTGKMISDQKIRAKNKQIPVFRMEGQPLNGDTREQMFNDNGAPTYFMNYVAEEEYNLSVEGGGGGVRALYFDTATGVFNDTKITYSDLTAPQLSDWAGLQSSDQGMDYRMYGGRDADVLAEATNQVIDIVDSINSFEITTERAPEIHIGDMVELIIPVPPMLGSVIPQNLLYSGFYLVGGVTHVVNIAKSTVTSTIQLMREGFDGKQLEGYTKSASGKFI